MSMEYKIKTEDIKTLTEIKGSCIASNKITIDGQKIGYMYKENPINQFDTGWRFFAGDEDEMYTSDANNFNVFDINTICNYDETIIPYLNESISSAFYKDENNIFIKER